MQFSRLVLAAVALACPLILSSTAYSQSDLVTVDSGKLQGTTQGSVSFFKGVPFAALAEREGVSRSYFTRLVRLSYLAPDITQAILDGRQPPELTAEKLLEHSRLPLAWLDQRTMLGFA